MDVNNYFIDAHHHTMFSNRLQQAIFYKHVLFVLLSLVDYDWAGEWEGILGNSENIEELMCKGVAISIK